MRQAFYTVVICCGKINYIASARYRIGNFFDSLNLPLFYLIAGMVSGSVLLIPYIISYLDRWFAGPFS